MQSCITQNAVMKIFTYFLHFWMAILNYLNSLTRKPFNQRSTACAPNSPIQYVQRGSPTSFLTAPMKTLTVMTLS